VRAHTDDFGVEVPLSMLMAARTVRELARRIDGVRHGSVTASTSWRAPASTATSLLQALSSHAGAPDVVFLPGVGGHVLTFAPIAEKMQSCGVGLRTVGSEDGETPHHTIEALAAHNLAILDAAGVRDDVVFAGYSFGGLVAYEMALQRWAQGRPPHQLVIFDTMAPGYPRRLPVVTRLRLHATSFVRMDSDGRRLYVRDRIASLREKLNLRLQRSDAFAVAFADAFAQDADAVAAMTPSQRTRLEALAGISTIAHHRYWPRISIPVPLTLFAAEQNFQWAATRLDDPLKGWRTWMTGPIHRIELPGDHLRLLTTDNHQATAIALDALIANRARS
jgi:thioesterase domain-containing protein